MSDLLSGICLDHINCQQHNQIANLICLSKDCQKRGVICPICQNINHKDHQIKPFRYFLNQITKSQKHSNKITVIASQIDLLNMQIQSNFNRIHNVQDKKQLEKTYSIYTQNLHNKTNTQFNIQRQIRSFFERNQHLSTKKLNQFIVKFQLHEYQPEIPADKPLTNQQKFLYQIKQSLKQKKDDFNDLLKAKAQIKDILSLFTFTQSKQKVNFTFSQQNKHTSIKITDKLIATQAHNYSSNFALIEPYVIGKRKQFSKKTVKIKMQKLNSWVNIGICIKSKAISANYYFNTQDIGHGAYTISNDGYSWHNTDSSLNSYYHGWSFTQGEVVTMTYDPKTKTIKYSKQNSDKQHELLCEPVPGQQMCFCVTLNTHDESVSIVQ